MWAGLRFINGYSPIRAAGVAREFATSIHGEINPEVGSNLLNRQAGPEGRAGFAGRGRNRRCTRSKSRAAATHRMGTGRFN